MRTLRIIHLLLLASIPSFLNSQVNFSHGNKSFDLVSGTSVFSNSWDDDRVTIPIGFDFEFRGETYNEVDIKEVTMRMSNFGGIEDIVISPFNTKTIDRGFPNVKSSEVVHNTNGKNGERVFTVQWQNVGFELDPNNQDFVNVQIKLHEELNKIEIIYGEHTISIPQTYFGGSGPKVSISKGLPYEYYSLDGVPSSPTLNVMNTQSQLNDFPSNGKYYLFSESSLLSANDFNDINASINVFPNPFIEKICLEGIQNFPVSYSVYSIKGKELKTGLINKIGQEIFLGDLTKGTYVIYFKTKEMTYSKKIVKMNSLNSK